MTKFFYIFNSMPSALFDTLEAAENSADLISLSAPKHITFYRIENNRLIYIYASTF